MNHEDATRLADRLQLLATAVRHDLIPALSRSANWEGALRSARLEPGGTPQLWCWTHQRDVNGCHRAELTCAGDPITTNDPTGEAALGKPLDDLRHRRLTAAVGMIDQSAGVLHELIRRTIPTATRAAPDPSIAPDGACESCWRDGQYFEPTAEGRYRTLCRWCGDVKGNYHQLPPLQFVKRRHRNPNDRISPAELDQALRRGKKAS